MKHAQRYLSYLLRLWPSGQDPAAPWQASLEYPMTGERRGFASLQEMFAFLEAEVNAARQRNSAEQVSRDQGEKL